MTAILRALRYSLFLRLFLIFGFTIFLFIVVLSLATHFVIESKMPNDSRYRFFERHLLAMIDDIGTPPDLEKAAAMATEFPMTIVIKGPNLQWQSDKRVLKLERFEVKYTLALGTRILRDGPNRGYQVDRGSYQFTLFSKRHFLDSGDLGIVYATIVASLGVLFINYWLVRRLLKPIRQLKQGAERISHGELDYRVSNRRADELGDLTSSINSMADSLQAMLAAKQQLLLAISHELRTPITRAKVQLEFLADEKIKKSLQEDVNEIDMLVSELLEAERLNSQHASVNRESTMFAKFIQNSLNQHWPDNDTIEWHPPDSDRSVAIDTLRITLLLRNLINNALRYAQHSPIAVSVSFTQTQTELSIQDRGEGIAEEHLPHLTQPFYRADTARQRQTGGFGLGLYLCRLIAEAHGGQLSLQSQVGKGTCVTISIPSSF